MSLAVGSLVKARGREWVVLPDSQEDLLVLRPLGGTEDEVAGIYLPLETVEPASFDLPDPSQVGDHHSCRLLRDAARLSSRAGAGPFRSFSRIAVEPRPYQLVPLLMALRLDPVRILIADDVGIGKTIEASLIARELLDRGEVTRTAVLCPPHLAQQWEQELREKFHIEAQLVLPGTAARLERDIGPVESLFDRHPHVVVSTDFIKTDRRRSEFVRAAPELVIVDEAHTCAFGLEGRGGRHQRHQLVRELAADSDRHLILVTATPHSGKEEAFRSLLGLMRPEFADLPLDLAGREHEPARRKVAAHFVQRRRADIRHFLDAETPFPEREEIEDSYQLSREYRQLFDRALAYVRKTVADPGGGDHHQRVRWWSALALLRSLASSPAAAAETLRTRAGCADAITPEEVDEAGRRAVLDIEIEDHSEVLDLSPGADPGDAEPGRDRQVLLAMAREAAALAGGKDAKLLKAVGHVQDFLRDGYHPILFCRFIATAEYVAREFRDRLPKDVEVTCVTGLLPPAERKARILELAEKPRRLLVATDCLSEGLNLQDHFNAVMHYDLSWSPTRHEQREGRVDRFGQCHPTVRVLTYYGLDNRIDGVVLDVLIRKHSKIRKSLGIAVPVPLDTDAVIKAIFQGLLLRGTARGDTQQMSFFSSEEFLQPLTEQLYRQWDRAADREKRSRTMFAQESIKVDEVARELEEARSSVGSGVDVERFTVAALRAHGAAVSRVSAKLLRFDLTGVSRAVGDALGSPQSFEAGFELPVPDHALYLSRTHPVVEALATHVMDTALDPLAQGVARRAGVIRTTAVTQRTTMLLVRFRYDLLTRGPGEEQSQLAEECRLLAFRGTPERADWLDNQAAETLLAAEPHANIYPDQAAHAVRRIVEALEVLRPHIEAEAGRRADALGDAHDRVRAICRDRQRCRVEPRLPADILGVYVYLPVAAGEGPS